MDKIALVFIFVALINCFPTNQTKSNTVGSCDHWATCEGSCKIENTKGKCGTFFSDSEYADCSCLFCRFDNSTSTCNGLCESQYLSVNKCVSRVQSPKQDSDCTCTTCKRIYDPITGAYKCTGSCGNGKSRKLAITKQIFDMEPGSKPVKTCQCGF